MINLATIAALRRNRVASGILELFTDSDVVARYDASDLDYVVYDDVNRVSALLDKYYELQLGAVQESGNLVINEVYQIVSTEIDYFGSGLTVGDKFVASSALGLSSANSVKKVLGNHLVQTDTDQMPILNSDANGYYAEFDGIDDKLKTIPFTFKAPATIYMTYEMPVYTGYRVLYDGDTTYSIYLRTGGVANQLYCANLFASVHNIGQFQNSVMVYNNTESRIRVNNNAVDGSVDSQYKTDIGGFSLGAFALDNYFSNIKVREVLIRNIADSSNNQDVIFETLKLKHNIIY